MLRLYHHLPPVLRSAAATARGLRLRWWRYPPESEQLIAEALERDRWDPERMRLWQQERLSRILHRAAASVPYYRAMWSERRQRGDRSSPEHLENWPLLDKDALRAHPEAFLDSDRSRRGLFEVNTSGTTGKPLRLWRTRHTSAYYYALLEARFRRWHGVSWREPWAILGGQAVAPPQATAPPFWVWNAAMHQLYLSANHISAKNVGHYADALRRRAVTHLDGYASSLAELARLGSESGVAFPSARVIITNAEPLLPWQRQAIERAFGGPARETYGMVEIVAGASECPSGVAHLWPDLGIVEVLDDHDDAPAARGAVGRLVCTGLANDAMPLIRYVVGDRGSVPSDDTPCACGRTLPRFGAVEGRSSDMLVSPDGRLVYWLNPVFYGLPVHEAQIVQERVDLLRVRLVPGAGYAPGVAAAIAERLKMRMGDVEILFEALEAIPRGPNGKFRPVIREISLPQGPAGRQVRVEASR